MASQYRSPGVYRQEVFLKPEARLETGVPGFVGLAGESSPTPPNQPVALSRKEEFATKFSLAAEGAGYLAEAVAGFFDNGGRRCYVARAANTEESGRETALLAALESLALWEDLDLLAVPDVMTLRSSPTGALDLEAVKRVQQAMLRQCAQLGTRLAILDAPPESDLNRLLQYRRDLTVGQAEPVNGAIYYPWLQIMGLRISGLGITGRSENRFVPPSGHVAGIYARTDAKAGVFKAPANEEVFGVLDLGVSDGGAETAIPLDNRSQDELNPEGINCLRAFRGRGLRVWGARTLSRQPEWRYVNVRRLFLTLRRWIEQNMAWASYEPNEARLWVRIQRELTIYLLKLWQDGALAGLTPEQAFYVKCDAETNPPEERELGRVVTEIGLAPGSPAEFIVIRITHRAGGAEVT